MTADPVRCLTAPQLAKRLRVPYRVIWEALTNGELAPDFALMNGQALFLEERLEPALSALKRRLKAVDYEEALDALRVAEAERTGRLIDTTDARRPVRVDAPEKLFPAAPDVVAPAS